MENFQARGIAELGKGERFHLSKTFPSQIHHKLPRSLPSWGPPPSPNPKYVRGFLSSIGPTGC